MRRLFFFAFTAALLAVLTGPALAAPAPPQLSLTLGGLDVTVSWSAAPGATGYTLYYAPYPFAGIDTIGSFDVGSATSVTVTLWDGAAFYVAVTSRDATGESGYSNIEHFTVKLPATGNWSEQNPMGRARSNFAGGEINRRIVVFGGQSADGKALATTEIFDLATGQWTAGANNSAAGQGVSNLSGAVLNDRLYVFGASDNACAPVNFTQEYTPGSNRWRTLQAKPTPVFNAPTVEYNGEIYLFGGWSGKCSSRMLKPDVEAFRPATGSWRGVTSLPPEAGGDAAVAIVDGIAYLMGGSDAAGNLSNRIIAYDFASRQWTTSGLGTLAAPRSFPTGAAAPVIDGSVFLLGGLESSPVARTNGLTPSKRVEVFVPRAKKVLPAEPLVEAMSGFVPISVGEHLYVLGGTAADQATDKVWRADITRTANVAYLYNPASPSTAFSYRAFLENNGFAVRLIDLQTVNSTDFSPYDLIFVDTNVYNTTSIIHFDPVDSPYVFSFGKPVFALGTGAAIFDSYSYEAAHVNGWGPSAFGTGNTIDLIDSHRYFQQCEASRQGALGAIYQNVQTSVMEVYLGNLTNLPAQTLGPNHDDPKYHPVVLDQGKNLQWGFVSGPEAMTDAGKTLFLDLAHCLIDTNTR